MRCMFCSNTSSLSAFYSRRVGRAPTGADLAYGAGAYADVPDAAPTPLLTSPEHDALLAARAQANGVKTYALTDHDELSGLADARTAAEALKTARAEVTRLAEAARDRGADVLLIFVEAYGVVSWEKPELVQALTGQGGLHVVEFERQVAPHGVSRRGFVDPLGSGTDFDVTTIGVVGGNVYIGGFFSSAGAKPSKFFAHWGQGVATSVDVADQWNLVSVPLATDNYAKTALFPTAVSNAFSYASGAGYVNEPTLKNGRAYWVKFSGDQTLTFYGFSRQLDSVAVTKGWNLIGAVSTPTAISSIVSIPGGIVTSNFFGYNAGYTEIGRESCRERV